MISLLWLLPFVGAVLLIFCRFAGVGRPRPIALAATGATLLWLLRLSIGWNDAPTPVESWQWISQAGLSLDFWLDGPSLFYAWLVAGIGFLVIQYAGHYMKPDDAPWRFYGSILLFLSAMMGLVLSRNLLLLFVFWELTSLTSFLLIGHWHQDPEARKGARRALLVTGMGGLALMAGIAILGVILYQSTGAMDLRLDAVWAAADIISEHPLAETALILMLLGVFTKSAQFPFHFWLPGAMKAPTPVSALLHAATMVKAGIYLLGRIYPVYNDYLLWPVLVGGAGVASMFVGGFLALLSTDLKKLLAYSTVSQLGLLTSYYGFGYQRIGGDDLLKLDLLLVASHALFKAGLFMLCGVIDHGTHTREWTRLGGLYKKMPMTAVLTIVGCFTMAGMPFTLGFVAKKLFFEASMTLEGVPLYVEDGLLLGAIVASVFTVGYSIICAFLPFFGKPRDLETVSHAHEGSWAFLAAPTILIGLCFAAGIYVPLVEKPVSLLVSQDFIGTKSGFLVAWFAKTDFLFWLSMGMFFVGGPLLVFFRGGIERLYNGIGAPGPFLRVADRFFDELVPTIASIAGTAAKPPTHKRSLHILFLTMVVLVGGGIIATAPNFSFEIDWSAMTVVALLLAVIGVVAAFATILLVNVYTRLLSLGLVGIVAAAFFIVYKAPDLAITQLLVELVILLMFLGLAGQQVFKKSTAETENKGRRYAVALSIMAGIVAGAVTYIAAEKDPAVAYSDRLQPKEYYLANAFYPEDPGAHSGGGNNVVNVTLVDFRALDTFGEIVVLAVAAIGAFTLFQTRSRRRPNSSVTQFPDRKRFVLGVLAPTLSLLCVIYALVLFWGGHQVPGGGFIAGLLAAVAAIPALMLGKPLHLPDPAKTMGVGILAAIAIGIIPVLFGGEFLKSGFGSYMIPFFGELKLSTALVFDTGVFLVVFGVTYALLRYFAFASAAGEKAV